MKTINDYEQKGYEGDEENLAMSLFEHGFIWLERENDIHFIYGVETAGNEYSKQTYNFFDWSDVSKDINPAKEWDFADFDAVAYFYIMSVEEFLKQPLTMIVADLIVYYGYENIFGPSYSSFEIKE